MTAVVGRQYEHASRLKDSTAQDIKLDLNREARS